MAEYRLRGKQSAGALPLLSIAKEIRNVNSKEKFHHQDRTNDVSMNRSTHINSRSCLNCRLATIGSISVYAILRCSTL